MTSKLKGDAAESAVGIPIVMVVIANFGRVDSNRPPGGIAMRFGTLLIAFALCVMAGYAGVRSQSKSGPDGFALVDKSGNISKPESVRDTYQSLGAYTVLDPNGNQMHMTYASPGSAEAYRKTGKFPDGTILVKEVMGTEHAQLTTGDAHWASGTKVWFVMIKDATGRYKNNPLWGNGWGWALFKSDAPTKQVATDYKKDCFGCHIPAESTDWIYVKGYPVLSAK
jgi:cytochrome P460